MTAPAVLVRGAARRRDLGSVLLAQAVRVRGIAPLGAAFLTVLVLQAGVAPHLVLRQAAPDVLLVGTVAVALGRGSRAGAGFGFAAGLGADLFLATPLGTSALAFTVIGHVLGQHSRARRPGTTAALRSVVVTGFGVGAGRLATVVVATGLGGVPFPGVPGLLRIATAAALSAPLGPLAFAAVRRLPDASSGGGESR